MPKSKNFSILLDYSHGEIMNLSDPDFQIFSNWLSQTGWSISVNNSEKIDDELLKDVDLLILGCPVNHYFITEEIHSIVDFVTVGGNLLITSEYGGDIVQKTNLNDLTTFFGIYFEDTNIRSKEDNTDTTSLPIITDIIDHEITKNVRKLILGGSCSLRTVNTKESFGICFNGRNTWIDVYDAISNIWVKNEDEGVPLIAGVIYGQGRVIALGDIDIFSNNLRFGINSLDNKKLISNIFNWFNQPVHSETTIEWLLQHVSYQRDALIQLKDTFSNLVDSLKILEKRITGLEKSQETIQNQILTHFQQHEDSDLLESESYEADLLGKKFNTNYLEGVDKEKEYFRSENSENINENNKKQRIL